MIFFKAQKPGILSGVYIFYIHFICKVCNRSPLLHNQTFFGLLTQIIKTKKKKKHSCYFFFLWDRNIQ